MFNLFKKKEPDFSSIKSTVTKANGDTQTVQIVKAKVIEVGDDEAEGGFSYKYSFTNPLTNEMQEGTDYLQQISIGEQLFEVGDDVNILLSIDDMNPSNFSVTRQMIFPKIINRKRKIRRLIKFVYTIVFIIMLFACCYYQTQNVNLFPTDDAIPELVTEETESLK